MPRRGTRRRISRGIFQDETGYAVIVEVRKQRKEKRFEPHTPIQTMKDWREQRIVELKQRAKRHAIMPGTFEHDAIHRYLPAVKGMPTYEWRKDEIAFWVGEFGERSRDSIEQPEIAAVLHRLFTEPRGHDANGRALPPYSSSYVNKRRTALLHLWNTLDGPDAPNPVRGIKKFREPDPEPRGYTYAEITRIFEVMEPSVTRARLKVMAYSGLPPAQVMRVEPTHVDESGSRVWVQSRRKGRGTVARWLPLTPEGVDAFRELAAFDGYGPYSTSSARHSFIRACKRAQVKTGRPYDLRHSFATATYAVSEQRAAQELLDHRDPRTSWRYIMGAVSTHIQQALPKLATAQRATRKGRSVVPKRGTGQKSA